MKIAHYEILGVISEGAMGVVHRARDPRFDRFVAIKVPHRYLLRSADVIARFRQEVVIQAKLSHPNIVGVYDFVDEGELPAMVMELVEGPSLADILRERGARSLEETIHLGAQILSALGFAHSRGLVHRDVKPSNVLVDTIGDELLAKVMDFGIAKVLGDTKARTAVQAKMGSLCYMSPEQVQNPRAVDARSDIYSAGITLLEMLTGRLPFDADTEYELMRAIVERPAPMPSHVLGGSHPLDPVLARALAKDPARRYASCDEFRRDLRAATSTRAASGVTSAVAEPPRPSAAEERARRDKLAIDASSLVKVLLREKALARAAEVVDDLRQRLGEDPEVVALAGAVERAAREEVRQQQIAEVRRRLERELGSGRPDEAEKTLARLVRDLGESIDAGTRRRLADAWAKMAIGAREGGDIDGALALTKRALRIDPESPMGKAELALAQRLMEARETEQRRRARVAELGRELGTAMQSSDLSLASRLADEFDRLQEHELAATARRQVADVWFARAEELHQQGALETCLEALERALGVAPEHVEAARLQSQTTAMIRQRQIEMEITRVRALIESGDLDAAETALAGSELLREHAGFRDLGAALDRARLQRRRQAMDERSTLLRDQIDGGDLDSAKATLATALDDYGDVEPFHALVERLGAALAERAERRQRSERVIELRAMARQAKERAAFDEAQQLLEQAQSLDENDAVVRHEIAEIHQLRAHREREQHRSERAMRAVVEIEELIEGEDFEAAGDAIVQAIEDLGEFDQLVLLRARLAGALRAERPSRSDETTSARPSLTEPATDSASPHVRSEAVADAGAVSCAAATEGPHGVPGGEAPIGRRHPTRWLVITAAGVVVVAGSLFLAAGRRPVVGRTSLASRPSAATAPAISRSALSRFAGSKAPERSAGDPPAADVTPPAPAPPSSPERASSSPVRLAASASQTRATLVVDWLPAGGFVRLDDQPDRPLPATFADVPVGTHRIVLRHPDRGEITRTIHLTAGDTRLGGEFPLPGTLRVNAIPWAQVRVDGADRGTTPLSLPLPAGHHRVVLRFPGPPESSAEYDVNVSSSEESKISHKF